MTRMPVDDFSELTVVDPAAELLAWIPNLPKLNGSMPS